MAGPFRLLFFFSSFGPLYLIFAIKLFYNSGVSLFWSVLFLTLSFLALGAFGFIRRGLHSGNATPFTISDVKAKDSEIFSYITTYIPPLITRDMSNPEVFLPLAVLYIVIGLAYMRLDSPFLNPFFILFGFRIYEGKLGSSKTMVTIIAHNKFVVTSGEIVLHEVGTSDLYYHER